MKNLISAEWYRARKSFGIFKWTLLIIVLFAAVIWLDTGRGSLNASNFMMVYAQGGTALIVSLVVAGGFVYSYVSKVLSYDVMAGNKISHIIISKCAVLVPVVTLFCTLVGFLISLGLGLANGFGDVNRWLLCMLVYTIANLRTFASTVLIMTAFKAVGMALVYARFMVFELLLSDLAPEGSLMAKVFGSFATRQLMKLGAETVKSSMVISMAVAAAVEVGIWYVISYISHKRRLFY